MLQFFSIMNNEPSVMECERRIANFPGDYLHHRRIKFTNLQVDDTITNYAENKNPRDRNITRSSRDRRKKMCVFVVRSLYEVEFL